MAGTKEIKTRIESVQETRKITNAMYLIASTKLRKARQELDNTQLRMHHIVGVEEVDYAGSGGPESGLTRGTRPGSGLLQYLNTERIILMILLPFLYPAKSVVGGVIVNDYQLHGTVGLCINTVESPDDKTLAIVNGYYDR